MYGTNFLGIIRPGTTCVQLFTYSWSGKNHTLGQVSGQPLTSKSDRLRGDWEAVWIYIYINKTERRGCL